MSETPGAEDLDYLDVRLDQNAQLLVQSQDATYFDNRLVFSYLDDPRDVGNAGTPQPDRESKEFGVVRLTNTGTGPFSLADPSILDGLTLAAGASIDVTVLFDCSR